MKSTTETQLNWLDRRATSWTSSRPEEPLSEHEQAAIRGVIGSADVIALGEMTHGSSELFQSKDRLLRFLVQEEATTVVVLEASMAGTEKLNNYVINGQGDPAAALAATGFWSCANKETLQMMKWIRMYNSSQHSLATKVKVHGCDIQSLDDPVHELSTLLGSLAEKELGCENDCENAIDLLQKLPNDRKLNGILGLLMKEIYADPPNDENIEQLQRQQVELVESVKSDVNRIMRHLKLVEDSSSNYISDETRFRFASFKRLIQQCLDHYAFDAGSRPRDRHMADNIIAIRERYAGERLVLMSANWHISRCAMQIPGGDDYESMGCLLLKALGESYRAIGSAFHHGQYLGLADQTPEQDEVVDAHIPKPDAFEFSLDEFATSSGVGDFVLNLRDSQRFPWASGLRMNVGEAGSLQSYDATFFPQRPHLQYDGLVFVRETTPISVLPEYYATASSKWGDGDEASSGND